MKLYKITDKNGKSLEYASEQPLDWEALGFGKPAWTETIPATEDTPEHYIQHPAEYTIEVTDITSQVEQEKINAEALAYLASTDWMIVRAMENADKPVPEEIKLLRQQARDRIVR